MRREVTTWKACMAKTTVKQNKKQTILPTCQEARYHFGVNVICRDVEGAWFLSKK
jgi:hypothetical protein